MWSFKLTVRLLWYLPSPVYELYNFHVILNSLTRRMPCMPTEIISCKHAVTAHVFDIWNPCRGVTIAFMIIHYRSVLWVCSLIELEQVRPFNLHPLFSWLSLLMTNCMFEMMVYMFPVCYAISSIVLECMLCQVVAKDFCILMDAWLH